MMIEEFKAIQRYLSPPADSFWKWSDDGEVIVWTDGRTIAFRGELLVVLDGQRTKGLPPLSAIVLLLAACRDAWGETSQNIGILHGLLQQLHAIPGQTKNEYVQARDSVILSLTQLDQVRQVLSEFRNDLHAKSVLVDFVFETVKTRTSPELAGRILDALAEGHLQPDEGPPLDSHQFLADLRMLYPGLNRLDADALRMRLQTGLDTEVLPAEVELPFGQKVRRLLSELEHDEELAGMARMAKSLMAVTNLPRPLDDRDDVPVGGVSDIANRGTLDRLLISELAQDDQTLMLRVAMNEALYLRRETPPRNPPRSRLVILDAGLRLWGTPRVFATSAALSLAALSDPTIAVQVLRPEGHRLSQVDLSTRAGLLQHLGVLRPEAHPGRSLWELRHRVAEGDEECDVILITGDDVFADPDFQSDLTDCEEEIEFVMTVSRTGEFLLMQRMPHGTKVLRRATLDLESLQAPQRRTAVPLIDPELSNNLPAILRLHQFPLRLPHHVVPRQTWSVGSDGALSVTNDRRLMHWNLNAQDCGRTAARQIGIGLPSRHVLWRSGKVREGTTEFVIGNPGQARLWLVIANLDDQDCRIIEMADVTQSPVLGVCDHAGMLFVIHKRSVDVCHRSTGDVIQSLELDSGYQWIHDRYFQTWNNWSALSYDGTTARFEEVVSYPKYADVWRIAAMFDVDDQIQGPVGLMRDDGSLYLTTEKKRVEVNPAVRVRNVRAISQNGRRICIEDFDQESPFRMIDTVTRQCTSVTGDPQAAVEQPLLSAIHSQSLRNKIDAVGAVAQWLVLQTRRGQLLWLLHDDRKDRLYLAERIDPREVRSRLKPLQPAPFPAPYHRCLKSAAWNDGSELFLDSRGMLHLRSGDAAIPELTLILYDQYVSGWCADGRIWGSPYFHGDSSDRSSPSEIWNDVLRPFTSRLWT